VQTPTRGPLEHVPQAPRASSPPRREQDLIVIPEAREPRRWGLVAALVAGLLALAVIVALAAYGVDQRNRADDLDRQLTRATEDQDALVAANTTLRDNALALEGRVGALEGDVQRAKQGRQVAAASTQEARQDLREARDELDRERTRFRSYMGPPVGDGPHVGRLIAVGADQSPARVTTDLGRWFTGAAATQAAIDDGVIGEGQTKRRYFRNDATTWRTVPLDPLVSITVLRWNAEGTVAISAEELQRLSRIDTRRARSTMHDPFRITVTDGRVTAMRQLRYR
jgi:hypothetical protein